MHWFEIIEKIFLENKYHECILLLFQYRTRAKKEWRDFQLMLTTCYWGLYLEETEPHKSKHAMHAIGHELRALALYASSEDIYICALKLRSIHNGIEVAQRLIRRIPYQGQYAYSKSILSKLNLEFDRLI